MTACVLLRKHAVALLKINDLGKNGLKSKKVQRLQAAPFEGVRALQPRQG